MSLPDVVSREQWLEARRRLLAQEKEHTRSRDALNARKTGKSPRAVSPRSAAATPRSPADRNSIPRAG